MNTQNTENEARASARTLLMAVIVHIALFYGALTVLGAAIQWPVSLGWQAERMLPLLVEKSGDVRLGYGLYLLSTLILVPVFALTAHSVEKVSLPLAAALRGLGWAAVIFKCVGIGRWLLVMPDLAEAFAAAPAGSVRGETIALLYGMVNAWGGGMGEVLGNAVFFGLAVVCLGIAAVARRRWGTAGFAAALTVALSAFVAARLTGSELAGTLVTVSGVLSQAALVAVAVSEIRAARRAAEISEGGRDQRGSWVYGDAGNASN